MIFTITIIAAAKILCDNGVFDWNPRERTA